jgi:hypothetical protein
MLTFSAPTFSFFIFDRRDLKKESYKTQCFALLIRDGFSYFRSGGWINIWGGAAACLAGAQWQRPERPRKMFNKICFQGLHGKI